MARGAVLQVTRLRRPAAVEPSAIPPLVVELNSLGWVGHQQQRFSAAQQTLHRLRAGGVPAAPAESGQPTVETLGESFEAVLGCGPSSVSRLAPNRHAAPTEGRDDFVGSELVPSRTQQAPSALSLALVIQGHEKASLKPSGIII